MRGEMLAGVIPISVAAAQRLAAKLEGVRGAGRGIDVSEEFRLLTLQVIGLAMLSLPPEECNRVSWGWCVRLSKPDTCGVQLLLKLLLLGVIKWQEWQLMPVDAKET